MKRVSERLPEGPSVLNIPGLPDAFSLHLPDDLWELRRQALELHRGPQLGLPDLTLIDARSWAAHDEREDWQIWRARRCAARLMEMPIAIDPGERLVGRPGFREVRADETDALVAAQKTLASVPPFPGGDPGHFHPDFETLLRVGVTGILQDISRRRQATEDAEKRVFYDACRLAMEGLKSYISRTADACEEMARRDPADASRWLALAAICRHNVEAAPTTFHQALQLVFMTEMALWYGEDHGLTCPGRLDQTLWPFYQADVMAGRLTPRAAFELICCLYIQLNRVLWPGSAVAVMVGGRNADGQDVTHVLTYLCLAARQATHLVYPTVGLAWHEQTPDALMDFALDRLATGIGDPALFNDELIARGLRQHGVQAQDCHNYMNSTCVEIKVCGASNMWVTQPYISCPQGLLDVLAEVAAGHASVPACFAELCARVRERLGQTIRQAAEHLHAIWHQREEAGCFPLASCLIADCLDRGRDFDRGGARYNWVENSFVGLANLVDSLVAIKRLVYEEQRIGLVEFCAVLEADYKGSEALRQCILNTLPKYGNDEEESDATAVEWAHFLIESTESNTVGLHRYVPGFFCWVMHEHIGSQTGATPDGRKAGHPLADGAGAAQGRETHGPTAAVLSTTKWDHQAVLGGLVQNLKFSRAMLTSASARTAARGVIETYLRRGGFEIQVNVVGREELLAAQETPDAYQDLLVRVAGYSDYFVHLNRKQQDDVIARTEYVL